MGSQPPMTWRLCGNQAKLWRTRAGVTREELAREANYDFETVKSMEQGRRRPTERFLQVTDDMCGAHGFLIAMQDYLGPEPAVNQGEDFFRYEAEAISFSSYEPLLIPGLLQTEGTMRALFGSAWPPLNDEVIEERVTVRLGRQSLLDKRSVAFAFVIGEDPLRHPAGDVEAHRRQLAHVLEVGQRRNVVIRVMPAGRCKIGSSFVMLEMPSRNRVTYQEANGVGRLDASIERVSAFAQQQAEVGWLALNPTESTRFVEKVMGEL
ncbi:helix-turn-helix domain-containing protein [Streptomyces roseoverticillatus]|uniref:helix-turn-helix domain-containing protein n=1 Tax=Streptomyces roseoverticillatus TaxID=66429 RepID=UPI0004BF3B47|nr:helix-turn-helix transcriptional regulator [Streptomyces roseoverticillatus]